MSQMATQFSILSIAAILFAAGTPGVALASSEHLIILEIELEGESCSSQLISASAQSCDLDELAGELCADLGGDAPKRSRSGDDSRTCVWVAQPDCPGVRKRMILEPGLDCDEGQLEAGLGATLGVTYGDSRTLVKVEIEIEIP